MKTKMMLIILLLFLLVGCVEIQVVVKKDKKDKSLKSLIPAYPSPRSDIRLLQEGAYPYPIEY